MAWRSSGTNNDEMVDNLKRFGVIYTQSVEEAFRGVDRRFFVPKNREYAAHTDQPLKEGNIHISAPHIYGSVVEALELTPDSSLSFLNLGCGTGYLSSLAAHILGPTSRNVGIEIHEDVVHHCESSISEWKAAVSKPLPPMDVLHGNALQIEEAGEARTGFDRIYIGASVERRKLPSLAGLLRVGGILVGPVDDELVKVVRIASTSEESSSTPIPRSFRGQSPILSSNFSTQILSGVRFAPLVSSPSIPTTIPSQIWDPSIHHHYPESFRQSCKAILLCSRAPLEQPIPPYQPTSRTNVACTLPRALWMEVLSFTHRDWFAKPDSDETFLRRRLLEEQAASRRAAEARMQAEARLHLVERERDVYRLLALRWQSRLQSMMREHGMAVDEEAMVGVDDFAEVASAAFASEPLLLRLGSLSAMMRQLQQDSDEEEVFQDADDAESEGGAMEDDSDEAEEVDDAANSMDSEAMSVVAETPSMMSRHQARTVSISSESS